MAKSDSPRSQAKITEKLILRTAVFLFVLAGLFFGYRYLQEQHGDFNRGASNSFGLIAAIQTKDLGSEAIVIHPDGKITGTSSWKDGAEDRDLAWRPDGKFLFFTSNRADDTYHVYRWNTDEPDAEARTADKRARSSPSFPADSPEDANDSMLIVSGGNVQTLDAKRMITPQVLPPPQATITESSEEDSGGSEALFHTLYGDLGTSFRYARWCKGNRYIAAIMQREGGEVLILQSMEPKDGKLPHPIAVAAGTHVEFDVNPKDGSIAYTIQGFAWPDPEHAPAMFKKGHAVTVPFRHMVGMADPDKEGQPPVAASPKDNIAFGSPSISPDGSTLLVTVGQYDASNHLTPQLLLSMPLKEGGMRAGTPLVRGEVYEPSWSPDGETITFAMRANGKRDVYTCGKDGSGQTNRTGGVGDFSHPTFSPQKKTAE